ncbi:tetratricopeptide repeat protein [Albirhodobacter sp. R86504]|uniref:tetratricopeptide repeat protein n=1 Tax=Albirhodobacter sp. R86504 TaxID=3093848 RepID=UPI00366D9E50
MTTTLSTPALAENPGAYLAGRAAAGANNYDVAAEYFATALLADPTSRFLQDTTVLMNVARGEFDAALALSKEIGSLPDGSQVSALMLLADDAKREDWSALIARIDDGANVGPVVAGLVRAWAYAGQGQISEATAQFDKMRKEPNFGALALYQKALVLAMVGDFGGAEEIFTSPEGASLSGSRRGLIARVEILSQLERNDDAIALIDEAFATDPDPATAEMRAALEKGETLPFTAVTSPAQGAAEAFFTIAGALAGDREEIFALIYARLGEYLRPDHVEALLLTAAILEQHEQYELATEAYGRVPADHPSYLAAELGRSEALESEGKPEAAQEALTALSKANPDQPLVWSSLADLLRRTERYEEAIAAYSKLIDLTNESGGAGWVAFYARGISYERSGDWPKAEADFRKALELEPDQPLVLNYLGYFYIDRNENLDEALSMIERAVVERPEDGAIMDSLGWGLFRVGRYTEAVAAMEAAVELMSDDSLVNDHLGDVYWAVGRQREARFQWRRALSFKPEEEKDAERMRAKIDRGLDAVLREEGAPALKEVAAPAKADAAGESAPADAN